MPSLIRFFIFKCFVFIAIVGCNKEDFVWDLPKTNPYDVVDTFGVHYPNQNSPVVVTAGNFNVTTSSLEVFGSVNTFKSYFQSILNPPTSQSSINFEAIVG